MGFFRQPPEFDLGELSIENMFITEFMPSASGTYVKVFLLAMLLSKEENQKYRYDNQTIASMLSLPIQDVHEAWSYWEKVGLVIRHFHDEKQQYDIEFISLRSLYIKNSYERKNAQGKTNRTASKNTTPNPFKEESRVFQTLTQSIEKAIGHPLNYVDHREISDLYENYTRDGEMILKAFTYCYVERNIRNIKTVKSTLLSWINAGLSSSEEVETYLKENAVRYGIYKEILKLLGIAFRQPNASERTLIDKWLDEFSVAPGDLFEIIKDLSKKTLNINFNYIDKMMDTLHQNNVHTYADFVKFEGEKSQKNEGKEKSPSASKRKNYTIEKEKTYTDEELETILLNKRK